MICPIRMPTDRAYNLECVEEKCARWAERMETDPAPGCEGAIGNENPGRGSTGVSLVAVRT